MSSESTVMNFQHHVQQNEANITALKQEVSISVLSLSFWIGQNLCILYYSTGWRRVISFIICRFSPLLDEMHLPGAQTPVIQSVY
jgi:hypothetical protein